MNATASKTRRGWVAVVIVTLSTLLGCGRAAEHTATIAEHESTLPSRPAHMIAESKSSTERPAWVDAPAGLRGGVYETKAIVGPEPNREACEAKLAPAVEAVLAGYVSREYGSVPVEKFDLSSESLRSQVVSEKWEEHVTVGNEDAVFLHARLRLDDKLRADWRSDFDEWITKSRTGNVVQVFAVGLGLLLAIHLVLRFPCRAKTAS
jgi:hypothetical protein